jgi:hypothetical protein
LKKRILIGFLMVIMFSLSTCLVLAKRPPRTALDVEILSPGDGIEVSYALEACGTFEVTGTVTAKRGDAGLVQTFVQYAIGEGSTNFNFVGDANIQIVSGDEHQDAILAKDQHYDVIWNLTGEPGTYEIRLFSQGETAKDGESDSRTVTLLGPPPGPPPVPPTDCETIDDEHVDSENPFGTSSGTFVDTYDVDGVYEVLMEEPNSHGTKNPTDDTADLNWIYFFEGLDQSRIATTFEFVGHIELSGEYLDSGFLEWDDQDTAFYVQVKIFGSWKTIAAITNIGTDRDYSVDIPDDSSPTIELRIVDNDRGPEGKSPQISSLYVDMACIVFEPALEYFIGESPFDIPYYRNCLRIGDIDFDGEDEVYLTLQADESWLIKYYEYDDGIWTEETIPDLTIQGWVQVEDVDGDSNGDLLTLEILPNEEFWLGYHEYDSSQQEWTYHHIGNLLNVYHEVYVENIDNDPQNEVIACKDPCDGYELKYFDYNTETHTWAEIGIKTWDYATVELKFADFNSNGINEIYWLGYYVDPQTGESALKSFELVEGNMEEHDILNIHSGSCMDIGDLNYDEDPELALCQYQQEPEREAYVKVYDYELGNWEEIFNVHLSEALGRVTAVAIADVDYDEGRDNELVIGLFDDGAGLSNMTIRYFEYGSDGWTECGVADPDMSIAALQIGDIDDRPGNEILTGLTTSYSYSVVAPEIRYYKVYRTWNE